MAKERFENTNFKISTRAVIQQANTIIGEYAAMGYKLTLRQLYYQFVARDLLANKHTEYKRLGSIVNDGRLAGLIDWAAIEDRTRNVEFIPSWRDPRAIMAGAVRSYQEDLWRNQEFYVEVWIEKEALFGVIAGICEEKRLPHFACRGYVSQSEAYSAGKRFAEAIRRGKRPVVLHLGDHDPSGIDMTRDNGDRTRMFARDYGVEVQRLALNMAQIEEYDPPPNPAKETDIRFRGYQEQYGDESWELDSLDPRVITGLISDAADKLIDKATWDKDRAAEEANQNTLHGVYDNFDRVGLFLKHRETEVPEREHHGTVDDVLDDLEEEATEEEDDEADSDDA